MSHGYWDLDCLFTCLRTHGQGCLGVASASRPTLCRDVGSTAVYVQMPVLSHAEHNFEFLHCHARRWGDAIYAENPAKDRYYMFINEVIDCKDRFSKPARHWFDLHVGLTSQSRTQVDVYTDADGSTYSHVTVVDTVQQEVRPGRTPPVQHDMHDPWSVYASLQVLCTCWQSNSVIPESQKR